MADDHHKDDHGGGGGGHGGGGHGGGHGGGGGHAEGEHEGAPEWLISFADNVALMMGFFVVLLAMNMKPPASGGATGPASEDSTENAAAAAAPANNDMLDWAIGVREAFNNPVSGNNPRDAVLWKRVQEREKEAEAKTRSQKGEDQDVKTIRRGEYYGMGGVLGFEAGAAQLTQATRESLQEILRHRRGLRNIIEIHGHVSAAEAFDRPDRGMALSLERATAVAAALVENGIGWNQISLIGHADNDRVAIKTYDLNGHRENQRVEVIETERSVVETQLDDERATTGTGPAAAGKSEKHTPSAGHH